MIFVLQSKINKGCFKEMFCQTFSSSILPCVCSQNLNSWFFLTEPHLWFYLLLIISHLIVLLYLAFPCTHTHTYTPPHTLSPFISSASSQSRWPSCPHTHSPTYTYSNRSTPLLFSPPQEQPSPFQGVDLTPPLKTNKKNATIVFRFTICTNTHTLQHISSVPTRTTSLQNAHSHTH